jgi:hypothetical protein
MALSSAPKIVPAFLVGIERDAARVTARARRRRRLALPAPAQIGRAAAYPRTPAAEARRRRRRLAGDACVYFSQVGVSMTRDSRGACESVRRFLLLRPVPRVSERVKLVAARPRRLIEVGGLATRHVRVGLASEGLNRVHEELELGCAAERESKIIECGYGTLSHHGERHISRLPIHRPVISQQHQALPASSTPSGHLVVVLPLKVIQPQPTRSYNTA